MGGPGVTQRGQKRYLGGGKTVKWDRDSSGFMRIVCGKLGNVSAIPGWWEEVPGCRSTRTRLSRVLHCSSSGDTAFLELFRPLLVGSSSERGN